MVSTKDIPGSQEEPWITRRSCRASAVATYAVYAHIITNAIASDVAYGVRLKVFRVADLRQHLGRHEHIVGL